TGSRSARTDEASRGASAPASPPRRDAGGCSGLAGVGSAQSGRATPSLGQLSTLPAAARAATADDRAALPAVPDPSAPGAKAAAAELRSLPRARPRCASRVHREVPSLEIRPPLRRRSRASYGTTTSCPATWAGWSWLLVGNSPALSAVS